MAVRIYSSRELKKILECGQIAYEVHMELKKHIAPGVNAWELDKIAHEEILKRGAEPAFLGFEDYPASICVSINDVVVHGVPKKDIIIQEGDLVSIDIGVRYEGYCTDTAWTWGVGKISSLARRLLYVTYKAFFVGLKEAFPGNKTGAIGFAIQRYVEKEGFYIIRQLVGHGVGKSLHEEPMVPNYGKRKQGTALRAGMVIAIEPMVSTSSAEVYSKEGEWAVRTVGGGLSAHFEHTVAITSSGPMICTLPKNYQEKELSLSAVL